MEGRGVAHMESWEKGGSDVDASLGLQCFPGRRAQFPETDD